MQFRPERYGEEVAAILALDGNGERLMPLAAGTCSSRSALATLRGRTASQLFAGVRAPEAALSGLYLYFSCLDEAHRVAQEIGSPEGSYWHAIMHRQEPDPGNSAYWFRRAGAHAIFPALHAEARQIAERHGGGAAPGGQWDPFAFIELCGEARRHPGSALERAALEIQRAEWQLLFDWCASREETI